MVLRIADLSDDLADPRALRDAYSSFPSGVVAVCCLQEGPPADGEGAAQPVGLAASSFVTVSLDPPLVSVCVRNESQTWPQVRAAASIGVSVLAGHQHAHGRALAGPAERRFYDVRWYASATGAVFLADAVAWLECEIEQEIPAGDHHIIVLRIRSLAVDADAEPLVFHASRFRSLHS